eukprot:7406503-Pyramimonas_sp.AAC.2
MAIRTYVIFAASLLRYVMQFYPLSRAVRQCEQKVCQKLIVGPRFSFNRAMCTRLRDLGPSLEFPDLGSVRIATQVRLAHHSSAFPRMRLLLGDPGMQDDYHPGRTRYPWWQRSFARRLIST